MFRGVSQCLKQSISDVETVDLLRQVNQRSPTKMKRFCGDHGSTGLNSKLLVAGKLILSTNSESENWSICVSGHEARIGVRIVQESYEMS